MQGCGFGISPLPVSRAFKTALFKHAWHGAPCSWAAFVHSLALFLQQNLRDHHCSCLCPLFPSFILTFFFFFYDIFVQSISVSSVAAWNLLRPSTKPCSCFPMKTCIVQNDTGIHPFPLIYLSGLRHPQVCTGIYSISSSTSWPRMAWACLG